ncbi:MAG: response regulator [Oscillochloridaceae bacterium]|nr:response regulator [Chloroflexaceae bacterium]MDW8389997.1 response regulator [Oscillochloridaceae bacterium]
MADVLLAPDAIVARPRLLVVEDDVHVRTFCQRLLRTKYIVETAEHGGQAIELLQHQPYDLALVDLDMPVMDGIALLEHIRQRHAETDVVVFTAYASVDSARQALKLGALDYLSKPVEAENLERTVRSALELRRIRQEKERLSDLVFMYQFSQLIATSLDVETQAVQIAEFLGQRFLPESLALSLLCPESQTLRLLAARSSRREESRERAVALDADCDATALQAAHLALSAHRGSEGDDRFAGVVLRSHDRPIGFLHLTRRSEQPPFDAAERRLLSIFAGQVAASLDNARLYQALRDQNWQTIAALAEAIEARDAHTFGHSRQVTRYAVRLAEEVGLSADRLEVLTYAGLLHDVGKIGIRDQILLKPGRLDNEEFAVMQQHPRIGVRIIERVSGLRAVLPIIESHHERYDGSGYPQGLAGEDIPLEARILAIADAFEAMTADRAYRPAMAPEQALEVLLRGRGSAWDPHLVERFVEIYRREGERLRVEGLVPQLPISAAPSETALIPR